MPQTEEIVIDRDTGEAEGVAGQGPLQPGLFVLIYTVTHEPESKQLCQRMHSVVQSTSFLLWDGISSDRSIWKEKE